MQRFPPDPFAQLVRDPAAAVAGVEAGGDRQGLAVEDPVQLVDGARGALVGDGQVRAVPEPVQPAQQDERPAEELHLGVDVRERDEVDGVFGEDLQPAGLVAGQGAELDVLADGAQQALLAPGQAVSPQVVGAGLVGAAEPYEGQQ